MPRCEAARRLLLAAVLVAGAAAQRPPCTGAGCLGVLGRVEEDTGNLDGALAVVPAPQWERRDRSVVLQGPHPAELEQVGDRTSSATQTPASIDRYIEQIDKDITSDSSALQHSTAPVAGSHVKITQQGLESVPNAPVAPPGLADARSGSQRQRILDEEVRGKLRDAGKKLVDANERRVNSRPQNNQDRWKVGSRSVSDDLAAAKEAIDSLTNFAHKLPGSATEYNQAPAHSKPISTTMARGGSSRDRTVSGLDPADYDGLDPAENNALKRMQQHALRQDIKDGSRPQLTLAVTQDVLHHDSELDGISEKEDRTIKRLRKLEETAKLTTKEREEQQQAEDKLHESHLAHELTLDHKAEKIALQHKEMQNEIDRVEAHMQNKASAQWEKVQAARKRAVSKESDILARRKWAQSRQDEKTKEALWQRDEHLESFLSHEHRTSAPEAKWVQQELAGIVSLDGSRKQQAENMLQRLVSARREEELEAHRDQAIVGEALAEHTARLRAEALEAKHEADKKARVEAEEAAHLKAKEAGELKDRQQAEMRLAAIQKKDRQESKMIQKEEIQDQQHGKRVVAIAEQAAERQAAQKQKMVQQEEAFRQQALHQIAKEERDEVAKKEARLHLQEKERQQRIKARDAAAERAAHDKEEAMHLAEERRRGALAAERKTAAQEEERLLHAREAAAVQHQAALERRRAAVQDARAKKQAELRQHMRARERKLAAEQLALDGRLVQHEIRVASERGAAAGSEARAARTGTGGKGASMAGLIATTAAHGAPKALRKKLSRVLRHQLFAVGGALGEGVETAMVAQGRDTLRDDRLQEASARKAHAAHAKVMQFAAEEKAKAVARHQEWEATARKARDAIVKKSRAKAAAHARLLQQVHKEQNSHLAVLKGIEARDEHTLKALEVQRAKLLSVSGGHDATLMNQGARMTRLFAAKNTAQVLREDYRAARKQVIVDKGALRLAQSQLEHLKARAENGDLSPSKAEEELTAHRKALAMLQQRVREAEEKSQKLEHQVFLAGEQAE